jgi:thiamine biosynthesis lipoprotein ApbE
VTRRQLLLASLGGRGEPVFAFGHESVLGTSLDLQFAADSAADAELAEEMVLDEIERLRGVLSTWDPDSEASRFLQRRNEATEVSADLAAVLGAFDTWRERTGGAVDPAVGAAIVPWEGASRAPDAGQRAAVVAAIARRHWQLEGRVATRLGSTPQVFASLAKGYVIDRALDAAMAGPVRGALLNLGGDLAVRGALRPRIDVRSPGEGTAAQVTVQDRAMATSGDYRRGYTIGGQWYSHLLDPRTAMPATAVRSATVTAPEAVTAGALATALAVMEPAEGQRLADSVPGGGVSADRRQRAAGSEPGLGRAGADAAAERHGVGRGVRNRPRRRATLPPALRGRVDRRRRVDRRQRPVSAADAGVLGGEVALVAGPAILVPGRPPAGHGRGDRDLRHGGERNAGAGQVHREVGRQG